MARPHTHITRVGPGQEKVRTGSNKPTCTRSRIGTSTWQLRRRGQRCDNSPVKMGLPCSLSSLFFSFMCLCFSLVFVVFLLFWPLVFSSLLLSALSLSCVLFSVLLYYLMLSLVLLCSLWATTAFSKGKVLSFGVTAAEDFPTWKVLNTVNQSRPLVVALEFSL